MARARALDRFRSHEAIPPSRLGRNRAAGTSTCQLRRLTGLASILVSVTVLSCATDERDGALTLADGSKLADLLTEESCGAVLVMSPQECLSCNGLLETWVERGRSLRFAFHLLMTETPSSRQVEALSLRRVRLSGVVSESHAISEPRAYLFAGGVVSDSIVGVAEQTLFLSRLMSVQRDSDDQSDCRETLDLDGVPTNE